MELKPQHIKQYLDFCEHTTVVPHEDYRVAIERAIQSRYSDGGQLDGMFISGGATRFIGLGAAAIELLNLGYNPMIYGGISAGSILLVPLIMGKYEKIIEYGLKATRKNIFKIPPTTEKGKISWQAVFRAIFGHYSFGIQDIKPMLREVISPYDFEKFQNEFEGSAYIMAVNANTGSRKLWDVADKCIGYMDYQQIVCASSRIPIMTQAEYIDGQPYFDGGLRNHIPTSKVLRHVEGIRKIAEIYSRPQNLVDYDESWEKNIIQMIWRTIRIMTIEISKRDEEMIKLISYIGGNKLKQFFLPNVLESQYDTNQDNLQLLKILAEKTVQENIGDFLD